AVHTPCTTHDQRLPPGHEQRTHIARGLRRPRPPTGSRQRTIPPPASTPGGTETASRNAGCVIALSSTVVGRSSAEGCGTGNRDLRGGGRGGPIDWARAAAAVLRTNRLR